MLIPCFSPTGNSIEKALAFTLVDNNALYMSASDFGAFDKAKWAVSLYFKQASLNASDIILIEQFGIAGNKAFRIYINSIYNICIQTFANGSNIDGELVTNATYGDASYHHLLFHYDSANATAGDRMKLWIDGSEITSFSTDDTPTTSIYNSTASMVIGGNTTSSIQYYDGLIYQLAFFSGTLPSISNVYGSPPQEVTGLTGLYSLLDVSGNDVTSDYVLSTNWSQNPPNTVDVSSTIPS